MIVDVPGVLLNGVAGAGAPARADIVVYRGVDLTVRVTVKDPSGATVNLTGCAATMTVQDNLLPVTPPRVKKSYAADTSSALTGVLAFVVPAADLAALQLKGYWWGVLVTLAGKVDQVVLASTMTVSAVPGV